MTERNVLHSERASPSARAGEPLGNSDVTRLRGVAVAGLAAAILSIVAVATGLDPATERSPGAVSPPHANLDCAACHEPPSPAQACQTCHGEHPSRRPGHARARANGVVDCVTCHREHGQASGVVLRTDGTALVYRGAEQRVVSLPGSPPTEETSVSLVPLSICASCHEPSSEGDPIGRCVVDGQTDGVSTCFDEHRSLDTAALGTQRSAYARLPAWTTAREVVRTTSDAPGDPAPTAPSAPLWPWALGIGLVAGGTGWVVRRRTVGTASPTRRKADTNVAPPVRKRLPVIDTATCIGCSACVDVCPYDVLELRDYVAQLSRPEDCCGLTLCEQRCPNGSLRVTDGDPIADRPGVDETLQSTDVPGLWLAGDLTGLPLIRNAINQGKVAVDAVAQALRSEPRPSESDLLDVVIVGSGPAGLSAALAAKGHGLSFAVLEQGSLAESIRSFPRGKLIFDQPLGIPLVGDLWLADATKEELLLQWTRIARSQRIDVHEGHRVTAIVARPGSFDVSTTGAQGPTTVRARKVVLAIGKRGTPRKLPTPIPEQALSRVHYSLADARSLAGKSVVIVGLGDVAMEAAAALARQRDTRVTIVYRGSEFRRGKKRNIESVRRLVGAGRIELVWQGQVSEVRPHEVSVSSPAGSKTLPYDALLVLIGAIAPWEFLERIGVRRIGDARNIHDPGKIDPARSDDPVVRWGAVPRTGHTQIAPLPTVPVPPNTGDDRR